MFGISFGEMVVLAVVALVVVGPRRLPSMLRSAGQIIGRVRRMAMDIRAESGIDEILDAEGIRSEIDNFRRMAAGEIPFEDPVKRPVLPDREREYPRVGSDAYGSLSEDLVPYVPAALAPEIAAAPTAALAAPADVTTPAAAVTAPAPAVTVPTVAPLASAPPADGGGVRAPASPPAEEKTIPRTELPGTVANTGFPEPPSPNVDVKN